MSKKPQAKLNANPRIAALGAVSLVGAIFAQGCSAANVDEPEATQVGDAIGTESVNCSSITGSGSIIDGSGNVWTLSGTAGKWVVDENGAAAGFTASVTKLFYSSHVISQENAAGGFWSWTNGAWKAESDPTAACHAPSPNGTTIPSASEIYDNGGDRWTVSSGVVSENGSPAGYTAGVRLLLWYSATIYQQNTAGNWWSWSNANRTWVAAVDPRAITNPNPSSCLPFTMPSQSVLFASNKKVFAHYFYPYPLSLDNKASSADYYNVNYLSPSGESNKWKGNGGLLRSRPLPVAIDTSTSWKIDNMKKEVKLAMAAGITGFTVDVMGVSQATAGSSLQNLFAAAAAVDSRFKIVVMPDLSALGTDAASVETIVESIASNPAAYHLADGRLVVSPFDASIGNKAWWQSVLSGLAAKGINIALVPVFLGWQAHAADLASISYGLSDWGTATPSSQAGMQTWPATAHSTYGKIFMTPIDNQQYRPKNFLYWEAGNSQAFRNGWTSAINGGADWVQEVTWSDFSESGQIEPYTDATLSTEIGTGYYNLNAYYASWFLTGTAPTINKDVLYYFYRREATSAAAPAQTTATTVVGAAGENDIELLGFLTAPGTLSITIGGKTTTMSAPAGITSFKIPLQAGTPKFTLTRAGSSVVSFSGGVQVYGASGLPSGTLDLTYWSGSASASGTCSVSIP
ncbi:MAG: glycoside hydrolase family 71 protein [Polyangiaceae bacterium]